MSLQLKAISSELLVTLRRLMGDEQFNGFYLVGGTSLALRYGHRESIDIDLFTHAPFDSIELSIALKQKYGMVESETAENTVRGIVGGIKVDLIAHQYPLLQPIEELEGIRFASVADVGAMKLNAIANRGSKKDFWDCAELLHELSMEELLNYCGKKYAGDSLWNVEKSLCFFDDAENEPDPKDLRGQSWGEIKKTITDHCRL